MNEIRVRLAALVASALLAALASHGVAEVTSELAGKVKLWVDRTFERLLLLGYAVVHPWLQTKIGGTGGKR